MTGQAYLNAHRNRAANRHEVYPGEAKAPLAPSGLYLNGKITPPTEAQQQAVRRLLAAQPDAAMLADMLGLDGAA